MSEDRVNPMRLYHLINTRNCEDVKELTDRMSTEDILSLLELTDETSDTCQPCSLIHRCAQVGEEQIMEHMIKIYIDKYVEHNLKTTQVTLKAAKHQAKQNVKAWVNQDVIYQHIKESKAIHIACLQGHNDVIMALYKNGADFNVKNADGLSPIHKAAQGNNPFPITYLIEKGIDVDCVDNLGETPLHKACQTGNDDAIYYILAWSNGLNIKDTTGETALHHAVRNVHFSRDHNMRAMKQMLIQGAGRMVKNDDGYIAQDLIDTNLPDETIFSMSKLLGKQPTNIPCCQKNIPMVKQNKDFKIFMIYVVLMLVCYILLQLYVFPYKPMHKYVLGLNIMYIIQAVFFCFAAFMNPGYMEPVKDVKFSRLVENIEPTSLCPKCQVQRTRDSDHCYICNRCVSRFDHHCNWINNCVGYNNHWVYYCYILTLDVYFAFLITTSFMNVNALGLMNKEELQEGSVYNWMGLGTYGKAEELTGFPALFNANRVFSLPIDEDALKEIDFVSSISEAQSHYKGILISVCVLASYFMLLLTWLLLIQTQNLVMKTTTFQRFSRRAKNVVVNDDTSQEFYQGLIEQEQNDELDFKIFNSLQSTASYGNIAQDQQKQPMSPTVTTGDKTSSFVSNHEPSESIN